jgi:hypothetical protein
MAKGFTMKIANTNARIVVVDDHSQMRDGLTIRITDQSGWEVCGVAATEDEGVAVVADNDPTWYRLTSRCKPATTSNWSSDCGTAFPKHAHCRHAPRHIKRKLNTATAAA